jgi:RNA polymerase sigma-70 factor, ECF subfamily
MRYLSGMSISLDTTELAGQETALIARIVKRDPQALTQLYELTVPKVYAVVMRVLHHAADAEEVVSEVYLQIWDKAKSFEPGRGSVMAWINTLAWSRAVDKLRKNRRDKPEQRLHPSDTEFAYIECEELTAEQFAESWSNANAIQIAFQELSDIQQTVLRMAYSEELSQQEIANRLDLPLGTVKSHSKRGLEALRKRFIAGELS